MKIDFNVIIPNIISRKLTQQEISEEEEINFNLWLEASQTNKDLYEKILSGKSWQEYESLRSLTSAQLMISRLEKRKRGRLRKLITAIGTAAAGIAAIILIVTQVFPEKQPITEKNILSLIENPKALLIVANQQIELSEQDHTTSWKEHIAGVAEIPKSEDSPVWLRIEVPRGGEYKLQLPDSTHVWLNAETVIEYPDKFIGTQRNIYLSGEAFFDVVSRTEQPFTVKTHENLEVTVLGTQFNLSSRSDEKTISVALVEGKVQINSPKEHVILAPSELAVFEKAEGTLYITPISDMRVHTAWTQGEFYYHKTTLDVIFTALERWYNIQIEYHQEDIASMGEITLTFNRDDPLPSVLTALETITGLQYKMEKSTVCVTP